MSQRTTRAASVLTFVLSVAAVVAFVAIAMRRPPVTPVGLGTDDYIGRPVPDLTLNTLDGQPVALTSLKGRVVVLDLWATWCPPCVAELPTVTKVAAAYADRGVAFYAINLGESAEKVRTFLERNKLDTPVLLDPATNAGEAFGAQYIPLLVVIDPTGRIVAHDNVNPAEAGPTLTRWIESALQSGQAK